MHRFFCTAALWPMILLAPLALEGGCESMFLERADRSVKSTDLERRNFEIDIQPIMRGTVAAEAAFVGDQPIIVSGYGLVIELDGTGGKLMPASVRASMLQEMARRGVGDAASGWRGLTPEQMLDSEQTAVVIVEGVIPPGGVKGEHFDLRVTAVPGTDTTSLEGGLLYTTDLRPGNLTLGSRQAKERGQGRGRIFINPFAEPDAAGRDSIDRLTGRILDGGTIAENIPVKLRLAVRSHPRAMAVRDAINSRFPKEPGQHEKTAHGKSGDEIMITVPPSFSKDPIKFLELIRHTSLRPEAVDQTSLAVRRGVLANPGMATNAAWRWKSLGPKAVPMFQDLYNFPEEGPRLAALTAGAYLDDPTVVPPLLDLAKSGTMEARIVSIQMLGRMAPNPSIDIGLRPLLNDPEVDIRLIAFEALEERGDPIVASFVVDGKFTLNLVPSENPLIYVAQTGTPRIVLFGESMEMKRPMLLSVWSNRLLIKGGENDDHLEIYYQEAPGIPAQIDRVSTRLPDVVAFLGHKTTIEAPAPGIGLTYSEMIGAVHRLWREGHIEADFKAEQDRVLAAIIRAQQSEAFEERPEFERQFSGSQSKLSPPSKSKAAAKSGNGEGLQTVPR